MTTSWQGLDAQPVFIEFGVVPPFGVDFVEQVLNAGISVAGLALADVAIEALLKSLDLFGSWAAVQFVDPFLGPEEDPVVDIDSVYLDVASNKLEAFAPMLAGVSGSSFHIDFRHRMMFLSFMFLKRTCVTERYPINSSMRSRRLVLLPQASTKSATMRLAYCLKSFPYAILSAFVMQKSAS